MLFRSDGLHTAQDPFEPEYVYYESQGGNISRRNVASGETVNIRARTVTRAQFGQQIARIRGDGTKPLSPEQTKQIAEIRADMKKQLADPNVATRWNWNTPFILSRHDANVFYSGADKLFKSVRKGLDPFAISPDLSSRDEARIRITTGFDAEGNAAVDATGGITRDATGAEENATIVTIGESPVRAGLLYVGTNDGKVWLTRNDGGTWEDLSGRFAGVPPFTHVSRVEPSVTDSATVYVSFDNHRDNDFTPYVFVSNDFGKTFRSIADGLRTERPNSVYVVREDPVNPSLIYAGTELGVYASLDKGTTWFMLDGNLPTVPVYDLQVHPRDHELIAGTHGRSVQILDVAPLQQMTTAVLTQGSYLFAPTVALQYGERPVGSEPRANRMWRGDRTAAGAAITYRLAAAGATAPRISIVNVAGDTVARVTATNTAGMNTVSWNLMNTGTGPVFAGFGGGAVAAAALVVRWDRSTIPDSLPDTMLARRSRARRPTARRARRRRSACSWRSRRRRRTPRQVARVPLAARAERAAVRAPVKAAAVRAAPVRAAQAASVVSAAPARYPSRRETTEWCSTSADGSSRRRCAWSVSAPTSGASSCRRSASAHEARPAGDRRPAGPLRWSDAALRARRGDRTHQCGRGESARGRRARDLHST